ncbi:ATP-binding protein [Paenibacillus chungangensis]|uniref:histidine kinase n=1 Tax=Paenibacillus chungangensis TaxID=696535 RepID=A0ABW3HUD8_9BACL
MFRRKVNIRFIIMLFLCFLFLLPSEANGNQLAPLVLDETTEKVDVYPAIEMMKDQSRQWTVQEVISEPLSAQFLPVDEIKQLPGFFEMATWVRFDVTNQTDKHEWLLEFAFPLIHELRIYTVSESGVEELHNGGVDYRFEQRKIDHRHFVYDLQIEPGETRTYYAFAVGGGDLHPPINIWNPEAFIGKTGQESTLLGIFYGIVLVMIIYNLFLYISLRIRSYLYYVVAITCTLMGKLSINGLGFQYLWPDQPVWNKLAPSFWVALACIFILMFTRSFLEADQYIPSFKKWMYGLISLNSIVLVLLLSSPTIEFVTHYTAQYVMVLAAMSTFVTVLVTAFVCLNRGARQARFYIAGWLIFLTGVTLTILQRTVVFPYSSWLEYAGQASLTVEVVLSSLALADKINIIRREKEAAEYKAQESQMLLIQNLEEADKLKDEFLAVTSHELRTPLYGMIGIAESLQDGIAGKATAEMKEQLSMIINSGQRLTHLLNDILDFSQLKHNSLTLQYKPVDVRAVIHLVCAISMPSLEHKPISLRYQLDAELPLVWGDENRLQQIFYNLIGNAIKYTDEGEIVIAAQHTADGLMIKVSDTGRGIAADKMERIFQPYQQGDDSLDRKEGGAGIGLSIAKRLIELHEGKLEVESQEGAGSTFCVTLQVCDTGEAGSEEAATSEEILTEAVVIKGTSELILSKPLEMMPLAAPEANKRPIVMIADDEPVNIQVLTNQLALQGYEVRAVFRGGDVFSKLAEQEVDLLILDIMMPDLSGYEVCRRLRQTYSLMELPILMLTARNQLQDKLAAFEAGANDYLVKPCDKQELLSRVQTLVRAKTLNQQLIQLNLHLEEKVEERTQALASVNQELNRSHEKLLALSASRRELLANIAHELGGPVTLVHSYIQSLQEGLIDNNDAHYQQLVMDKMNVLNRLIDDLFDLSKLEADQASFNRKKIRLDTWMNRVFAHCEFAVMQAKRQFERGGLPDSCAHYVSEIDLERMDQVFTNVISNAVKHTIPGSGKIIVEASMLDSYRLLIRVQDNGVGISEEELPYIFERFYKEQRASSSLTPSGTGLGLAIVKQIVHGHQGEAWAESRVKEGTAICFTLPVSSVD